MDRSIAEKRLLHVHEVLLADERLTQIREVMDLLNGVPTTQTSSVTDAEVVHQFAQEAAQRRPPTVYHLLKLSSVLLKHGTACLQLLRVA